MSRPSLPCPLLAVLVALACAGPAAATGKASVAALQVALQARGLYVGTIDGVPGRATARAVRKFQHRAKLPVDGVVGPQTRAALGRYAKHRLGTRELRAGARGWDVAALQFLLAWHGFPSGPLDGHFAGHTAAALRRFQRWEGLPRDGVAGPAVLTALRAPRPRSPLGLAWPLRGPLGDGFGPRGSRFHAGIDIRARRGELVRAAAAGRVAYAGWRGGGYGKLVTIVHAGGVRTNYAHLSKVLVTVGRRVRRGTRLGRVGATGHATGPHLHFEVLLRGAAVDPLTALCRT